MRRKMIRKFSQLPLLLLLVVTFSIYGCVSQFKQIKSKEELTQHNPKRVVWEKDNSEMVLVPSGNFDMGDHLDEMSNAPVHRIELDAFYMDIYEVTVAQFKEFVTRSGYKYGGNWSDVAKYSPSDDYPMVYVSWNDAVAYADWVGKRLPTEAEWEYAARGGLVGNRYPLGNQITHKDANYSGATTQGKINGTLPVHTFQANGYGLFNMAGNVWEWCSDWYDAEYYKVSSTKNPLGPSNGTNRVLRGGSWANDAFCLRVADRDGSSPLNKWYNDRGFRCVISSYDLKK